MAFQVFTTVLSLYFFSNSTSEGVRLLWKCISVALGTSVLCQAPAFLFKFFCLWSVHRLSKHTNDEWTVIQLFWQQTMA